MAFHRADAYYYDVFTSGRDYEGEARTLRRRYPHAKTVLEIGSGTGSLTRELINQGFQVVALEPSFSMAIKLHRRCPEVPLVNTPIERFETDQIFDLVVAHYDVLNYVKPKDFPAVMEKIQSIGARQSVEMWYWGVRPFGFRKAAGAYRIRIAIPWIKSALVWFLYWSKPRGLEISFHKMYFHKRYGKDRTGLS